MNWLAHAWLARYADEAIVGAVLGDFALGTSGLDRWGPVVHREILVHRRIDRATDTHPDVVALRGMFGDGRRRYCGIVLDVYFDHVLARDWSHRNTGTLDAFTSRVYRALLDRLDTLPPRLQALAPRMAAEDWLGGYRDRESVDRAIVRIARRLSRNGDRLVACLDDLRAIEGEASATFDRLLPALVDAASEARARFA